jgi:hemolysin activation/secretion protein
VARNLGGRHGLRRALLGAGACLLHCAAFAQVQPDAGRVQEQLRTPAPAVPPSAPGIRIEPPRAQPAPDTPPFFVAAFRVTGSTLFSEAELLAILGDAGRPLTLGEIQARADRLTARYKDRGYVVARALVPAQDVRDGVVEIRVLEGRYGRIDIRNATELSEKRIRSVLGDSVREEQLVHGPSLERSVLLLSDLAGIQPRATLQPGESAGLTDLVLELAAGSALEADASVDNFGSRFLGRNRLLAGLTLNSPLDLGDRASLRLATSGEKLLSLRLAYDAPIGGSGLRAGPYVSRTTYELGADFAALQASGTADGLGFTTSYPLVRSARLNVRALASAEARALEDRIGATSTVNRKRAAMLQFGLSGEARDDFLAGGITALQLLGTAGELRIRTPDLATTDAAGARTQGHYDKLVASFSRVQGLSEAWRLSLAYTAQRASKNLDSSEKMSVGGTIGVRAYPAGEAAGDDVQLLQAELRYAGWALLDGQLSPFLFLDAARSRINHQPFAAGRNLRELRGWGLGAEWSVPGKLFVRAWAARKLGNEAATADTDRSGRLWLQAGILY